MASCDPKDVGAAHVDVYSSKPSAPASGSKMSAKLRGKGAQQRGGERERGAHRRAGRKPHKDKQGALLQAAGQAAPSEEPRHKAHDSVGRKRHGVLVFGAIQIFVRDHAVEAV